MAKEKPLDLTEGHRLAFDAIVRLAKGETTILGLRPRHLSAEKRKLYVDKLLLKGEDECYWCFTPLGVKPNTPNQRTLDHVIPKANGGPNILDNLVLCCRKCNEERAESLNEEQIFSYYGVTKQQVLDYINE